MAIAKACPGCGQKAPIVLRGVNAFCTVCDAPRTPLAGNILNLAGQTERWGGYAARFLGWGAMGVGLFLAFALGLIVQAIASMISPGSWLGLAVGAPIAFLAVVLGIAGIVGGNKLGRASDERLLAAQRETIHALARHQKGVVKIEDAARALDVDAARADAVLGALAREPAENVSLDVNDDGEVVYLFGSSDAIRWRIQAERAGIRVEDLEKDLERAVAAEAQARAPRS